MAKKVFPSDDPIVAFAEAERRIEAAFRKKEVTLDLSRLGLTSVPDSLGKLERLEILFLYDNRLTSLPESLGQMHMLGALFLFGNRLTSMPKSSGNLAALQALNLADNHLVSIPEAIRNLPGVKEISLANNKLTSLPDWIGDLTTLEGLVLYRNQLSSLPEALLKLGKLKRLFLHENPTLGLPDEVLGPTSSEVSRREIKPKAPAEILSYYFETQKGGRPLNEVKLLLVGRGGAGKTSVMLRLRDNRFNLRQRETEGITIKPWQVRTKHGAVHVHTWDFAGQVITHATHQFFLTTRSVYLLVLTGRENSEKSDAEYWLRLIRAFGSTRVFQKMFFSEAESAIRPVWGEWAPVIVVLNKCRSSPCHLDRNALQEKYPFILGFIETDCKQGDGIRALKSKIIATIEGMESVRRPFPSAWFGIKNVLANPTQDYISYAAFREICERHGERDLQNQAILSGVLHELGVALNYSDDARLKDKTVLNPQWVTNGIYTLLRKAAHPHRPEEMWMVDVERELPSEKPEMRCYLVELMRRFELAFPITEEVDRWLVPQRLPESQPVLDREWQAKDVTRVRYTYAALPEGLVPRFITRTYPLSEDQPRWVNGVILADDGAKALVKADPDERTIMVSVIGKTDARPGLMALVCEELQRIHDDIKGLGEKQEVELKDKPGVWVLVGTLKQDEKANKASATDSGGQGTIAVENTVELNRISAPAARDATVRRPKVFISYSKHDVRQCDALLMRLKRLRADGLVEAWNDRDIRPGEEWDGEIKKQLEAADVVIFLVSQASEVTDYIQNTEIPIACGRAAKGECSVVPVILEKCEWTKGALGKYNGLPSKGKPVRDSQPQRDAWFHVQQKLRDLLTDIAGKMPKTESRFGSPDPTL